MIFTVSIAFAFIAFLFTASLTIGLNELVCAEKPSLRKPVETREYLVFSAYVGLFVYLFVLGLAAFIKLFG